MKRRLICIASALLLCAGLIACTPQKKQYSTYSMEYFDTVITVTGYEYSQEEFDTRAEAILAELGEYHRLYSIYHRFDGTENLCTVNELTNGAHRTVTVDQRIIDLLLYAKETYQKTNGTVNVAMGSVLSLWHDYRTLGKDDPSKAALPPTELLKEAAKHTDINDLIIDDENNTVTLSDPLMTLDVGAIAKGYAAEQVARSLEEAGVTNYVLNLGGNVRTIGTKADGSTWTVGIEDPDGEGYLARLGLNGQSVVTSGSYQRFYYVDGKAYHHIIHPDTLMPADYYVSVSVVCKDSGLGDALSTALFCLPPEEALDLIESTPDAEAMLVTHDGKQNFSSGWEHLTVS